jgi:hypothetical protein
MKQASRILIVLSILLSLSKATKANLYLHGLSLKLECIQPTFCKDDIVQFNLTLSNATEKEHSILLPGTQNKGTKLIHFSFFRVQNNFYTEVYRESTLINMGTDKAGSSTFKMLRAKESITIPLFLNDKANYKKHIEAHHPMPNLPCGQYEVLVWYSPWGDSMSKYIYHQVSDWKSERTFDPEKINLPEGSLNSNYVQVNIVEKKNSQTTFKPTKFCPANCNYCNAIEKNDWNKVADIIDRQSYYHKTRHPKTDTTWQQKHRNVVWLSEGPDGVLACLPTWYSRNIIFKNTKGYHYYSMSWQMGKIYRNRSNLKMFGNMMHIKLPIKTEEQDYFRLVSFSAY